MINPWDRMLWGIRFVGGLDEKPMMLGSAWHREANLANKGYAGEPSHALLFRTRKYAREYCASQMASYATRGDVCSKWKFTPIRVREIVQADLRGSLKQTKGEK